MSKKHVTFADLLKAKQVREEINVSSKTGDQPNLEAEPKVDQPELKPQNNHNQDQSSIVTQIIDHTDRRSNRPMNPQTVEKGYFLPNWIQDKLLPTLEVNEQVLLLGIIRLTVGSHGQTTEPISFTKLAEKCNISVASVQRGIKSLRSRLLIKVHSDLSRNKTGGNKYELTEVFYSHSDHRSEFSVVTQTNIER